MNGWFSRIWVLISLLYRNQQAQVPGIIFQALALVGIIWHDAKLWRFGPGLTGTRFPFLLNPSPAIEWKWKERKKGCGWARRTCGTLALVSTTWPDVTNWTFGRSIVEKRVPLPLNPSVATDWNWKERKKGCVWARKDMWRPGIGRYNITWCDTLKFWPVGWREALPIPL